MNKRSSPLDTHLAIMNTSQPGTSWPGFARHVLNHSASSPTTLFAKNAAIGWTLSTLAIIIVEFQASPMRLRLCTQTASNVWLPRQPVTLFLYAFRLSMSVIVLSESIRKDSEVILNFTCVSRSIMKARHQL